MKSEDRERLEARKDLSGWIVDEIREVERQRYLLSEKTESDRTVDRARTGVTVFVPSEKGQGRAHLTLHGHDARLSARQLEELVFMGALQGNPPYTLPEPEPMSPVALVDPALASDLGPVVKELEARIREAVARTPGIRLSAAEIFGHRSVSTITTSTGVEASREGAEIYLEMVLLARSGDSETEAHVARRVRRLSDLPVEQMVEEQARFAQDSLSAELPTTRTGPVVMSRGTFTPLFRPFQAATSGETLYRKISPVPVGSPMLGERAVGGDRLQMTSDPTVPFGASSSPFDGDGLALRPVPVIRDGVFDTVAASKRFADYLQIPATGAWSNLVVAAGSTPTAELLDPQGGTVLHVVEFSWLNPNRISGAFSTEIRLGYEIGPDGTRVVRGGSLSGNAYDAFAEARFSSETELRGSYRGPKTIRFENLRVTGG